MIQIYRKEGWVLNPNDKVVNGIFKMVERNNGECPCHNNSEDKHCPCDVKSGGEENVKNFWDTLTGQYAPSLTSLGLAGTGYGLTNK